VVASGGKSLGVAMLPKELRQSAATFEKAMQSAAAATAGRMKVLQGAYLRDLVTLGARLRDKEALARVELEKADLLAAVGRPASSKGENYLVNGSFQNLEGNVPASWMGVGTPGLTAMNEGGVSFVRLYNSGLRQVIAVPEKAKTVTLRFMGRDPEAKPRAFPHILVYRCAGDPDKVGNEDLLMKSPRTIPANWSKIEDKATLPKGAKEVLVSVWSHESPLDLRDMVIEFATR
jgi:hypothetical protein